MCGRTPDVVIYSMFHRNPLRGFGAPGGRYLPIPITLAIGFYNSLHYRASRDAEMASLSWSRWRTGFNGFQSSYAYKPVTALEEGKEKPMAR